MNEEQVIKESDSISIVVFYTVIVHYVTAIIKALRNCNKKVEISAVYYDKKDINKNQYTIEEIGGVNFRPRSTMKKEDLLNMLIECQPHIIYVSGWMDKEYLWAIKKYRRKGFRFQVVTGIDDQWFGTIRQYLGLLYFRLFYRKIFDYMWVSGKAQYHYAQRFGYKHENIISNLLSADYSIFKKEVKTNKRFVFLGRFVSEKGLGLLINAYNGLPDEVKNQWPLVLIGDGNLKYDIEKKKNKFIILKPFLQPEQLIKELSYGGVFCLPSNYEPWGVVIHELALLGYPLILSSACGAATEFLITGYNGYLFRNGDINSLRNVLIKITRLTECELAVFSKRSSILGQRINSEHSAYSLLSVLELSKM